MLGIRERSAIRCAHRAYAHQTAEVVTDYPSLSLKRARGGNFPELLLVQSLGGFSDDAVQRCESII